MRFLSLVGILGLVMVSVGNHVAAPLSTLTWRSDLYPEDWTPPGAEGNFYTDKLLQDYSRAGYRGGDAPIPDVEGPIFDVTDFGADPSGESDSTSAIQGAINDAVRSGGGVVYLPAGTYAVAPGSGSNEALRIAHSNIILRGAGTDETFLVNTSYKMRGKRVIKVIGPSSASWFADHGFGDPITRDLMGPTRVIPVMGTAGFSPGDRIMIRNTITEAWIEEHNEPNWAGYAGHFPGLVYSRDIVAVDEEADTLLIDAPIRYALKQRDNARIHPAGAAISGVGLEDFSIGNVEHPGDGWGQEDYTNSGTAAHDVHGSYLIALRHVENSWIRRVSSFRPEGNTLNAHKLSNGVRLLHSRFVTLDTVRMQRVQYGGGGGNGYNFRLTHAGDNLLTHCLASHNRHGFVFSHMGATGNVIHNSTDQFTRWAASGTAGSAGSDHHMHFSHSNLLDMNLAIDSHYEARYRPFGSVPQHNITASHSTFWNTRGEGSGGSVVRSDQARYGYVIGTRGLRPGVTSGSNRAQTGPDDHVEGVGDGATLAPQSLYLNQLERRLNSIRLHLTSSPVTELPRTGLNLRAFAEVGANLDADRDDLIYQWDVVDGPGDARLEGAATANPRFVGSRPGDYVIRATAHPPGQPETAGAIEVVVSLKPFPSTAEMVTDSLSPTDDAFVHIANPDTNYGSRQEIWIKELGQTNTRQGYVKFDFPGAGIDPDRVEGASLHLYKTEDSTPHIGRVSLLESNDWTEDTLTWNNRPTEGQPVGSWSADGGDGPVEIDVSEIFSGGSAGEIVSLRLQILDQDNSSPLMKYGSKEHISEEQRPKLVVTFRDYETYGQWADTHGIPTSERDPDRDRFGRGITNLMAYATGISPESPSAPLPRIDPAGDSIRVDVPWRTNLPPDTWFLVERSEDLENWQTIDVPSWETESIDEERQLYRGEGPAAADAAASSRFFRLRLIQDED